MTLKTREKTLLVFVLIAVAIFVFDRLYYTPQDHKIKRLKEEVKAADIKLKESLLFVKGVEAVEAEVARLESELKRLNEQTLKGEEFRAFLRHLAKESSSLQMKIISLVPQEEKLSLPGENKVTYAFQYKKVTVQMVLHSTYTALGAYLKGVEELPFLVAVDYLQIERKEEILPFLKVTMGLSVIIVS